MSAELAGGYPLIFNKNSMYICFVSPTIKQLFPVSTKCPPVY